MKSELDQLARELFVPDAGDPLPEVDLPRTAAGMVVALPAGGFGYRMRAASDTGVTQKALLPLPNGETLIGRLVRQYAEAGFREFVALVNHEGAAVEAHLDGGRPWGVEVRCSYDPQPTGSGRTGAMLHAMAGGVLPADRPVLVHNADCHLMGYPGSFPRELLRTHAAAVERHGAVATLAAVDGSPYPYTGMSIRGGRVREVEMYPFIPVPVHTGITVLTPAALEQIHRHPPGAKSNFERDYFPRWAAEGRLGAMVLPYRHWVAVDDRKAYKVFCEAVDRGE